MPSAARSPSPDTSGSDTQPIAFDSETELLLLLSRLRDDLTQRVRTAWEAAGSGDQAELDKAQKLVLRDFFDNLAPSLCANTSIAGLPYRSFKSQDPSRQTAGPTQPFDFVLHTRVTTYQDKLFVDRTKNVIERVGVSEEIRKDTEAWLETVAENLQAREGLGGKKWPEPSVAVIKKPRKSSGVAPPAEPDAATALEAFTHAKDDLTRLLSEVPKLTNEADEARKVASDARALGK